MHLIIVEDLEMDREKLAELIQANCESYGERADLSFYGSGEAFLADYRPKTCDGLFLDILLGGITGMDAARKVREYEPRLPIIFTTTERDYAVDGFAVDATDYLIKPLDPAGVSRCMGRLRELLSRPSSIPLLETSAWGHAEPVDVPFEEILYAQYANHIMDVHTTQGVFCTRLSFQDFAARLPHTGRFCVCGRGLVINLSQVARIHDGSLLLKNGDTLPIPVRRRKDVQRAYTDWKFICSRKGEWV